LAFGGLTAVFERLVQRLVNRIALAVVASLALGLVATAAQAGAGQAGRQVGQISFYLDINQPVNLSSFKNPLVVRPAAIYLFEDGTWLIKDLHWTGWGTSVASATGTGSSSDCKPDCATGQRTETPARFTVSSPGRVLGHEVYRCYQLTVPSHPSSNGHGCLARTGKLIGYTAASKPSLIAPKVNHVKFYTPSRNIYCGMTDDGSPQSTAGCEMLKPPAIASLFANGRVLIRQGQPAVGNPGEGDLSSSAHLLPYGSSATAGRFRCKSTFAGVTCVVIKTGKGFFISKQSVRAIG
jgi:hypothetical protein